MPKTMNYLARRLLIVPAMIALGMLVGTSGPRPLWYFNLLRWVICTAAVAFAVYGFSTYRVWAGWTFGVLAVLFNPLVPVHLARKTWQPIDAAAGIAFIVGAILLQTVSGRQKTDSLSTNSPRPGPATDSKLPMGASFWEKT